MEDVCIGGLIAICVLAALGGTGAAYHWNQTGSESSNQASCALLILGGIAIVVAYAVIIG